MGVSLRPRRSGSAASSVVALLVLAIGMSGCGGYGSGEDLYSMACAGCHGADRTGIAGVGPDLSATSFALEESDEWLAERIHDGFQGMPAFGRGLTAEQTAAIITYLRDGGPVPTGAPAPPVATTGLPPEPAPTSAPPGTGLTTGAPAPTTAPSGAPPPATTAAPGTADDGVLALGRLIFDSGIGPTGRACADCHGSDARGTPDGPNIIGVSKSAISGALGGGVADMEDIVLSRDELDAVYGYLQQLTQQAPGDTSP